MTLNWFHFVALLSSCVAAQDLTVTNKVYFDLSTNGNAMGRITLGLYGKTAPKTVENFRVFATTGFRGLGYKGTKFHRVIAGFMMQGGDIENKGGIGGFSIYGDTFPDETFAIPFTQAGQLAMANRGPNTDGSQFFVTFGKQESLNGGYVVFGQVLDGMDVVNLVQAAPKNGEAPTPDIIITASGELAIDVIVSSAGATTAGSISSAASTSVAPITNTGAAIAIASSFIEPITTAPISKSMSSTGLASTPGVTAPQSSPDSGNMSTSGVSIFVLPAIVAGILIIIVFAVCIWRRRRPTTRESEPSNLALSDEFDDSYNHYRNGYSNDYELQKHGVRPSPDNEYVPRNGSRRGDPPGRYQPQSQYQPEQRGNTKGGYVPNYETRERRGNGTIDVKSYQSQSPRNPERERRPKPNGY
ncbi:cyclophilin-like domain-containing protein [Chytriomyces sp. MP71]|nr:cyclophilin-like domain-containing protein [Chytriomyces sp. MP71]